MLMPLIKIIPTGGTAGDTSQGLIGIEAPTPAATNV
jgi:hypothetical protein